MPKNLLNEREFELVNIVGAQLAKSQRDLSKHMNLSLGMTNMLLRRLVTKGIIRIQQLNRRKVHYILTPKGFSEKMRKSVNYTLKTINSISLIKERLKAIIKPTYERGERIYYVVGKSDLAFLVEVVFKEEGLSGFQLNYLPLIPTQELDGVVLICEENRAYVKSPRCINLIYELAQYPS